MILSIVNILIMIGFAAFNRDLPYTRIFSMVLARLLRTYIFVCLRRGIIEGNSEAACDLERGIKPNWFNLVCV